LWASADRPQFNDPMEAVLASRRLFGRIFATEDGSPVQLSSDTATGGGQPHENMQPFLALNFVIALQGLFPSR
jgi:microcystin-dependent protein